MFCSPLFIDPYTRVFVNDQLKIYYTRESACAKKDSVFWTLYHIWSTHQDLALGRSWRSNLSSRFDLDPQLLPRACRPPRRQGKHCCKKFHSMFLCRLTRWLTQNPRDCGQLSRNVNTWWPIVAFHWSHAEASHLGKSSISSSVLIYFTFLVIATNIITTIIRQHCRLTICIELVELTNSIRWQDPNNNTDTETRCLV